MPKWHTPVDPACPEVREWWEAILNDPLTHYYGAPVDELGEDFERRHMAKCRRCQLYGAENVDIVD